MTFLACLIAFQIGKAFLGGFVWSQSCLTLYFALRMSIHKLSLFETIIHPNLQWGHCWFLLLFLSRVHRDFWDGKAYPKLSKRGSVLDFLVSTQTFWWIWILSISLSNGECPFHGQDWFEINERLGCATSFKKILTNATMMLTEDFV